MHSIKVSTGSGREWAVKWTPANRRSLEDGALAVAVAGAVVRRCRALRRGSRGDLSW